MTTSYPMKDSDLESLKAIKVDALRSSSFSISRIQRYMRIGYNRAVLLREYALEKGVLVIDENNKHLVKFNDSIKCALKLIPKYSKTTGHHCWWLNVDGKAVANFDNESDVDAIIALETGNTAQRIIGLEMFVEEFAKDRELHAFFEVSKDDVYNYCDELFGGDSQHVRGDFEVSQSN